MRRHRIRLISRSQQGLEPSTVLSVSPACPAMCLPVLVIFRRTPFRTCGDGVTIFRRSPTMHPITSSRGMQTPGGIRSKTLSANCISRRLRPDVTRKRLAKWYRPWSAEKGSSPHATWRSRAQFYVAARDIVQTCRAARRGGSGDGGCLSGEFRGAGFAERLALAAPRCSVGARNSGKSWKVKISSLASLSECEQDLHQEIHDIACD